MHLNGLDYVMLFQKNSHKVIPDFHSTIFMEESQLLTVLKTTEKPLQEHQTYSGKHHRHFSSTLNCLLFLIIQQFLLPQ